MMELQQLARARARQIYKWLFNLHAHHVIILTTTRAEPVENARSALGLHMTGLLDLFVHLFVGGLREVAVPASDVKERLRRSSGDDLVDLGPKFITGVRGGNRHGHDKPSRSSGPKCGGCGAHSGAGSEPIVNQKPSVTRAFRNDVIDAVGVKEVKELKRRERAYRGERPLPNFGGRTAAQVRVRYGCRRLHVLLRRDGWQLGKNQMYRLYCEEQLQLRSKLPKRRKMIVSRRERPIGRGANDILKLGFCS
jgi:hypothetical protein